MMWYPKCASGFYAFGCCVCSPNCINGMPDIGVSCQKSSYGRSAGTPMICASGLEQSGALCYPSCKSGYNGIGPVCWGQCPAGYTTCGALCTSDAADCTEFVLNQVKNAMEIVVSAATQEYAEAVKSAAELALGFVFPMCAAPAPAPPAPSSGITI